MSAQLPAVLAGAVTGYLVGSILPAAVLARRRGRDLGEGSGNPGATNVARLFGRRLGVVVGLLDMLKGLVPAVVFGLWSEVAGLVAGLAAVVGHVWSPWFAGLGGRGVATAEGAVLGSQPPWGLAMLAVWVVVLLVSRWVTLASIAAALTLVVIALVTWESVADVAWAVAIAAIVLLRHRDNVVEKMAQRRAARREDHQQG